MTVPHDEINQWFEHHPPSSSVVVQAHERVRELCGQLAHQLNGLLPAGTRETLAALDAIDLACMHANASVARHMNRQPVDIEGGEPPAAVDLPAGVLDVAVAGAAQLHAPARTAYGRNVLAHALHALARGGWLHDEPIDPHAPDPYVHDLLDAYTTGQPLSFGDHPVPVAVVGRLAAAVAAGTIRPERLAHDPARTRQYVTDVPDYVWCLVAALGGVTLDFGGCPVPPAVTNRLAAAVAAGTIRPEQPAHEPAPALAENGG